jgi:hypothetical protein
METKFEVKIGNFWVSISEIGYHYYNGIKRLKTV